MANYFAGGVEYTEDHVPVGGWGPTTEMQAANDLWGV